MISPLSQNSFNQLQPQALSSQPTLGGQNPGGLAPLGDLSALSPEAQNGQNGDMTQMMEAMMNAFGMGQQQEQTPEQRIAQLQQEIQQTEQQLGQAEQAGDQQAVQGLTQKLDALKAELAQLTGQGGAEGGGGAPGGGGGAPEGGGGAPAGGGGAPAGGGGAPAGGGGAPAGGGGGAPAGGGGSPSGGGSPVGGNSPVNGAGGDQTGPVQETATVPPELAGDDKKMAEFIEGKLAGTPLEGKGLGAHFVAAGKQQNVDPLVLASISKHETGHGKLGVGVTKHMGVGAFDSSPNKARKWDGAVNQIYSGAKTFNNLRRKGGSNPDAPISQQLSAVNRAGWATDKSWHSKVGKTYNNYASSAQTAVASSKPSSTTSTPSVASTSSSKTSSSKKA
jgi:hypothetical protein